MKPVAAVKTPLVASNISRRLGESVFSRAACGIISRGKGQHFDYTFDTIGNRQSTKAGGDNSGADLRPASYSVNMLNQYTSRDVPGYANALGTANSNATVTLWSDTGLFAPTLRKGDYFRGELPVNNSTGAVWLTLTNVAVLPDGTDPDIVTNTVGNAFLPKSPESFGYDADGNLTNDGRWALTWDGENRLVAMTSLTTSPSGSKRKVEFAYDHQSRRIQKIVSTWNGSSYVAQSTNRFVYDGWNLIAILNPPSSILQSFTWGLDLSGSLQGAGGVGGLLAVNDAANGAQFCAYDGNGNLTALVKATDGAVTANYEYGPFGETLRLTGAMAKANPFRFSTKYQDDETDLLYYGYRSYNPGTGRWLSRDPIRERGGNNLYIFVRNEPSSRLDYLGLTWTIQREHGPRARATSDTEGDTFDDLARLLHLDISDYTKWLTFNNGAPLSPWFHREPVPCMSYSVPNTVYIDTGVPHWYDIGNLNIIVLLEREARKRQIWYGVRGYKVEYGEHVGGDAIMRHLFSKDNRISLLWTWRRRIHQHGGGFERVSRKIHALRHRCHGPFRVRIVYVY